MAENRNILQSKVTEITGGKHLIVMALVGVSIFLAYSNSLNGTWALDDILARKPVDIEALRDLIGFRKVTYLSFLLNQRLAPFSPANFRGLNIFIHFINAVLVYVLAYKTMLLGGLNDKKKVFLTAFFSSLFFALHPLNINAVAYIIQRMTSLATFFVLLSLLSYILAAEAGKRLKAALFYMLCGILVILGIFAKENAVMAIPLIILYNYVFLKKSDNKLFLKKITISAVIGLVSIGLAAYLLGFHHTFIDLIKIFTKLNQPLAEKGWTATDVYWTPLQHILTELRVVSRYIFLIFIPLPAFMVFDSWGYPVSHGITAPVTTLWSLIFLLVLLMFSIWKIKRFPLLCFGILWYLLAISLESFLALGSDLYFEHRNYLPLTGLIIGLTGQSLIMLQNRIKGKVIFAGAVVFCLLLGSLTVSRNFVWKDSITLWGDTLSKNPANIRAMIAMGNLYLNVSDIDNAEKYFTDAVKVSSQDKRVHFLEDSAYSLGMVYLYNGKLRQAKKVIDLFDNIFESYRPMILRGFYKAQDNDIEGALKNYSEALKISEGRDMVVIYTLMGDAYRTKGAWDAAIEHYNKAITNDPGFASAYYGKAVAYMSQRNLLLAQDYFSKTLAIEPDHVLALSDMADLLLIKRENPEQALYYARKAISKSPTFYQPYAAMGNVLIVLGRTKEAEDYYKTAVGYGMTAYMVPFSMARAYYIKGDKERAEYYLSELRKYKGLPENIKGIVGQR